MKSASVILLFYMFLHVSAQKIPAWKLTSNAGISSLVYPINVVIKKVGTTLQSVNFTIYYLNTRVDVFGYSVNPNSVDCRLKGDAIMMHEKGRVNIAVCDGIVGDIMFDKALCLHLKPLLTKGPCVSLDKLSATPHLLETQTMKVGTSHQSRTRRNIERSSRIGKRSRRNIKKNRAKLTIVNQSNSVVLLYYMDIVTHTRIYFMNMRRNERNILTSFLGITWLAYDEQQQPLLLNKRYNFLVLPRFGGKELTILVTSLKSYTITERLKNLPKVAPKYVEVFIVADSSFVKFYGSSAKQYIHTKIELVNHVFAHESLNTSLYVVVKEILLLNDSKSLSIKPAKPHKGIQAACQYAFDQKKKMKLKFDFAIVLTRIRFGYSGFTPLYRMCVPYKSCTLVRDSGLHTAFIIAHEIGHSVGLSHDGEHNDCEGFRFKGSIMAPLVYSKFSTFHWSPCSKIQMRENVNYFPCLNNRPPTFVVPNNKELLGEKFTVDDQCGHYLGKGFTNCLGLRAPDQHCNFLFCRYPRENRCAYWAFPPLDGSECAKDKWCIRGKCLQYGLFGASPINGSWSSWQEWSDCNSGCGQSVSYRQRSCDSPRPEYNGKTCEGNKKEWKLCYKKPCRVNLTFADIRNDYCYNVAGTDWAWMNLSKMKDKLVRLNLNCTFDNYGICNWKQKGTSKYSWQFGSGKTPTANTGPQADHNQNITGAYLFMESSYPLRAGDEVVLMSPNIDVPKMCLHFYYHMFGKTVGHLKVTTISENNKNELWRRSRSQGERWQHVYLSMEQAKPYKIEFTAVRGSSYLGDIAIDDITVTAGKCRREEHAECKFTCFNMKMNTSSIDNVVPNGGRCNRNMSHMCMDGKCVMVSCDGTIGSNKTLDRCGVCGGNGSTCRLYEGLLKVNPLKVTESILKIPPGAKDISIAKLSPSVGRIGIRETASKTLYFYESSPIYSYKWHYFPLANATFRYQVFDQNKTESIFSNDHILAEIELQLVYPNAKSIEKTSIDISYSFLLPLNAPPKTHVWRVFWTPCNASCGGGVTFGNYSCYDVSTRRRIENTYCSNDKVKVENKIKLCNTRKCQIRYEYKVEKWSKCSPCGVIGFRHREVTCYKTIDGSSSVLVNQNLCKTHLKPSSKIRCFVYCPKKKRKCIEKSKRCPDMIRKGYCKYSSVQALCCKSCQGIVASS